jgi:hypothetical protein
MNGLVHHYNWVTKKDEYYHVSCRRIMLLLTGEAAFKYNLGDINIMTIERKRNTTKAPPKKVGESKWEKSRRTMVHFANARSIPNTYCYTVCSRFVQSTNDIKKVTCNNVLNNIRESIQLLLHLMK